MPAVKPVIGLCGGIGAGKSSVARVFAQQGALLIDSDALNHEVLAAADVIETVASWWGPEVLTPAGRLDRQRVAARVFDNPSDRQRLEKLVHPLIARRRTDMIRQAAEDSTVAAIILDSPLLYESNLDRLCHAVVFVDADEQTRLQRVQAHRKWNIEQLQRRERCQLPLAEKRARAQYVIDNEGSPADLERQAQDVFNLIVSGRRSRT